MSDLVDRARAALDGVTPDSELFITEVEWFCEIGIVDGGGIGRWEETVESHTFKTLAQAEAFRDQWLRLGKLYRTQWGELRPTGMDYGAFSIRKGSRTLPAPSSLVPEMADRIAALESDLARAEGLREAAEILTVAAKAYEELRTSFSQKDISLETAERWLLAERDAILARAAEGGFHE